MPQSSSYAFLSLLHALMSHLIGPQQGPNEDQPIGRTYQRPGRAPTPGIDAGTGMEIAPGGTADPMEMGTPRTYGQPEDQFDARFDVMRQALLKALGNGNGTKPPRPA